MQEREPIYIGEKSFESNGTDLKVLMMKNIILFGNPHTHWLY